jgi:hypothetical protein
MDLDAMLRDYAAQGGKVKRIAQGKRALPSFYTNDVIGDDNDRAGALARLADYWERKERRKARRAINRALDRYMRNDK